MKNLFCLIISLSSISAFASPPEQDVTVQVGRFSSLNDLEDASAISVTSASATVFVSSDASTLSLRGCHKAKNDTGQSGPDRISYTPYEASETINVSITDHTLGLQSLKDATKKAHDSVKAETSFYCKTTTTIVLNVTFKIEKTQRTASAKISINSDHGRYTVGVPGGQRDTNSAVVDLVEIR